MKAQTFNYLLLVFILFFYLYPTLFVFVPGGISTRLLICSIGLIIASITYFNKLKDLETFFLKKEQIITFNFLIALASISIISLLINGTSDMEYIKYMLSMLFIYFSYIPIKILINKYFGAINIFFISNLIINAVLIQIVVALSMYIFPVFGNFIKSIQIIDDADLGRLSQVLEFRLVGLGTKFFASGIINAFTLILIAFNIRERKLNFTQLIKYTILFIVIFAIGMMMSRTTLIGAILGLIYIMLPNITKKGISFHNSWQFILLLIIIPLFFISFFIIALPEFTKQFQSLFKFGFELFINFSETGKVTSESTEDLKTMYIFPDHLKTYIIGDGKFTGDGGKTVSYYMGTDVGYLRLIYYFGVIGLLIYFLFQYFVIKTSFKNHRLLVFFIFILLVILNLKGVADLFYLSILFNIREYQSKPIIQTKPLAA
ncbi:MAG: hypothetical protein V4620_03110 [Bacteroidota bacterium]